LCSLAGRGANFLAKVWADGERGRRGTKAHNEVWGFAPSGVQGRPLFRSKSSCGAKSIIAFRRAQNLYTFYPIICKMFEYHRSTALIRV